LFLDSFLVSITVHKRKRPAFFLQVPSATPPATSEKKNSDACRPSTPPLVPVFPTLIRLSLPPSPGPVTLGRRFYLIFVALVISHGEEEEIMTRRNIFRCCFRIFVAPRRPWYRHPLRASNYDHHRGKKKVRERESTKPKDSDGSVPVFLCAFFLFRAIEKCPDVTPRLGMAGWVGAGVAGVSRDGGVAGAPATRSGRRPDGG
jgi:hypothetical protein